MQPIKLLEIERNMMPTKDLYKVSQIFTPASPAKINFVEREDINRRIVRALKTPGMQIIVYGQSGSGKTTLLENKLFQVYERHIKTSCMKGMNFESVLLDAFDQLSPFYLSEESSTDCESIDINLKASFKVIDSQIKKVSSNSDQKKHLRVLPPQLTAQSLARFMGGAGYCWILDDFHKIDENDKEELSQLMKVFMDMSNDYPDLKIICVGAVNSARQVVQYDVEMRNRVSEIKVSLMSDTEIKEIVDNGFSLLNVKVSDPSLFSDIYHYTNGLAAICHKLCLLMCESIGLYETFSTTKDQNILIQDPREIKDERTEIKSVLDVNLSQIASEIESKCSEKSAAVGFSELSFAVSEYLDDASDTIKSSFDSAFRVTSAPLILEALSEGGEEGECVQEIFDILNSMGFDIDEAALVLTLRELMTDEGGGIVTYDISSHLYRYTTPFLMVFARSLFEHSSYRQKMSQGELLKILNSAFNSMQKSYS